MAMAVALLGIVAASLLFHILSPWWTTPLASNWWDMDSTLAITLLITGVFFIGINVFIAYTLWRFRHREGDRAVYVPDNKKLERWLIVGTTLGIVALLAPGLFVYAEYVRPPRDAITVEVLGLQWQWRFRFPGPDGKLGGSEVRFVSDKNPFGLDPDDPAVHDNILITGSELHLPLNRPVKVVLRSHDVLHDFYVPQFRARMNMVPGMVTSFWFTPTKAGRYEILCAQFCGVGHFNMRGHVVVEDEATFQAWLRNQPTFAIAMAGATASAAPADPKMARGKALAQSKGCMACHSVDGSAGVGPTWKGLAGKNQTMADGTTVLADEAYLRQAIREPQVQVVKGYQAIMPKVELTEDEVSALVAYIQAFGTAKGVPAAASKPQR